MKKKKVAIIGSHGIYGSYGGWDQLVNNLCHLKDENINYLVFNPVNNILTKDPPKGIAVKVIRFRADGIQGIIYDFLSIIKSFWTCDTLLLLGIQGMPLIYILRLIYKKNIVLNLGGIEWERPQFNFLGKLYLRLCFILITRSNVNLILDNEYYKKYLPNKKKCSATIIPYGGTIDSSKEIDSKIESIYPFLKKKYFLSIGRSIEDNKLMELCETFTELNEHLVLISNFSNSFYGNEVLKKFETYKNITLINGLYEKPILDLLRRKCFIYIHTHTLCGTAPSLVEMIMCQKPIISIDVPQNRFTLQNEGSYFTTFKDLKKMIIQKGIKNPVRNKLIFEKYSWGNVVSEYEKLY